MFYFNPAKNRYDFIEIISYNSLDESMNTKRKNDNGGHNHV